MYNTEDSKVRKTYLKLHGKPAFRPLLSAWRACSISATFLLSKKQLLEYIPAHKIRKDHLEMFFWRLGLTVATTILQRSNFVLHLKRLSFKMSSRTFARATAYPWRALKYRHVVVPWRLPPTKVLNVSSPIRVLLDQSRSSHRLSLHHKLGAHQQVRWQKYNTHGWLNWCVNCVRKHCSQQSQQQPRTHLSSKKADEGCVTHLKVSPLFAGNANRKYEWRCTHSGHRKIYWQVSDT